MLLLLLLEEHQLHLIILQGVVSTVAPGMTVVVGQSVLALQIVGDAKVASRLPDCVAFQITFTAAIASLRQVS